MLTKTPTSRPGHSFNVASSRTNGAGLYCPAPSSIKTDWPICIGLKASPIADVALPACQTVQLNSGAGSLRESYERSNAGGLPLLVPLYTAVTALHNVSSWR